MAQKLVMTVVNDTASLSSGEVGTQEKAKLLVVAMVSHKLYAHFMAYIAGAPGYINTAFVSAVPVTPVTCPKEDTVNISNNSRSWTHIKQNSPLLIRHVFR